MVRGAAKRVITRTEANEHSSRSHTIFQVHAAVLRPMRLTK
jgi:hypothetical protein